MFQKLREFSNHKGGSIATIIGLIAVALMLSYGLAIDYSSLRKLESNLQNAAHAAALASAKESS